MTLGETEIFYHESNSGWPGFLSIIFSTFQSTNFMDYMALQRYVSIILSVITIIPVYLLGKQFFAKQSVKRMFFSKKCYLLFCNDMECRVLAEEDSCPESEKTSLQKGNISFFPQGITQFSDT